MPERRTIMKEGNIYHVFNKSLDRKAVFENRRLANAFLEVLFYYRSQNTRVRYSRYKNLLPPQKNEIYHEITDPKHYRISIIAYCLMPNHFHLLLEQHTKNGISEFMAQATNSFTRYYNIMNQRKGQVFLTQFRAVHVKSDEQLKHVSRYIHLNPNSSHVVDTKDHLEDYPFSSYRSYVTDWPDPLVEDDKVLSLFENDRNRYRKFVMQNADYQEKLEYLKHTYKW